jgi:acetyl esterase/lipase
MKKSSASPLRIRLVRWVVLPATVLLFLSSLLVFVSAPTEWTWIVAIIAGECGHYAAVVSLLLASCALGAGRIGLTTALLAAVCSIIYMTPAVRAFVIARSLPARCTSAFGAASGTADPLNLRALFVGRRVDDVHVTEHEYAKPDGKSLKLDLYRRANASEPQPLVIMIHGGSWNGGSKTQLPAINRHVAAKGYAVASINYRHAPKWRFPAPVDDVFAAIEFLRANASRFGIDASRVVLIGRSAGGQLALSAAYSGRDAAIRGVVSFYAPTDLVLGYEKPSRPSVLDSKKALEGLLGGGPADNARLYAAASPGETRERRCAAHAADPRRARSDRLAAPQRPARRALERSRPSASVPLVAVGDTRLRCEHQRTNGAAQPLRNRPVSRRRFYGQPRG